MSEYDRFDNVGSVNLDSGLRLMESIIGGRWNPMILFAIEQGATRYSDIRASVSDISDTELQRKLGALTLSRLVSKNNPAEDARRSEYLLTDFGGEITHTLRHIMAISRKHGEMETS